MATWNNLDTLASYEKLAGLKNHVDIKEAMAGENGAERVAKYTAPMAEGLSFNYAAKQVDDTVLTALTQLAEEAQLAEKFEELYNGAVINTGEKRLVLHHLARRQLGNDVVVDGVNKREFYVSQQEKAADFANKVHAGEITNAAGDKKVVEESGLTRKYVEHYGEFAPSADQRFAYSFVGLDEDSNSPLVQLWKTREKVIKDFATAKPCVIVGSCADYILRDREDCLKVFLYADEETKENRIQEIYGEAGLKLKNRVKDMDVRRGLNYKYFTGQDWGKAQNYDLALNRGSLGIEKCAQLIVDAASEE